MENAEADKQERFGLIGAKEGDVLRRKRLMKPNDEVANRNLGHYSYFDCIIVNRPELRGIKLEKNEAKWGASVSIPESDLSELYYEVVPVDKIPDPITLLIKEHKESKKESA